MVDATKHMRPTFLLLIHPRSSRTGRTCRQAQCSRPGRFLQSSATLEVLGHQRRCRTWTCHRISPSINAPLCSVGTLWPRLTVILWFDRFVVQSLIFFLYCMNFVSKFTLSSTGIKTFFCGQCYICCLFSRYKEFGCMPLFTPVSPLILRVHHRGRHNIEARNSFELLSVIMSSI